MDSGPTLTPRVRTIAFFCLLVAFACNVTVLLIPFMEFRKALAPTTYTFFTSVEMLWEEKLYALVFLVVGFSLIFPFFKLAVLFLVVLSQQLGTVRMKLLHWVEKLAKWSMLDVFFVCLALTLTSGQVLVSATPRAGVPLFIASIVISMVVGQVLAAKLLTHSSGTSSSRWLNFKLKPWVRLLLVSLSGLLLLGALLLPLLKIDSWFLIDGSFSILTVGPALWKQESYSAFFAVGLFLILFPVLRWGVLFYRNWGLYLGRPVESYNDLYSLARYWSMLDVFALALGVFLIEGSRFVPADAKVGSALLVFVVFANVFIASILEANPEEVE